MKFADFKKGAGAQVFAGLGEGGFWLDDLEHAKDWRDLRDRVLASNSNTSEFAPSRFAKAVRRYASVCSRPGSTGERSDDTFEEHRA
jgi:hypothetical protein